MILNLDATMLDILDQKRIYFLATPGQRRLKAGDTLRFQNESRVEPYVGIYRGNAIPKRMGSFSYSVSPLQPGLAIGRYCSIAHGFDCHFPNHHPERVSTSTFMFTRNQAIIDQAVRDAGNAYDNFQPAIQKPFAVIENDVWIGSHVRLMPGCRLGNGCVVGAGSVVTKDVPPYAIVGGVPAKVIRYRFPDQIIADLLDSQWWQYRFTDFATMPLLDPREFITKLKDSGVTPWTPEPFAMASLVHEAGACKDRNTSPEA